MIIKLISKLKNRSQSQRPLKAPSRRLNENIPSNQDKGLNRANFITSEDNWRSLGKISEAEKIEIIKLGFQLQAEGKISLKKYYESTDPNSLFQLKGFRVYSK